MLKSINMANKNSCIIHPKAKNGKLSNLFTDLRKEFSYNNSWDIWDAAVSPEYKEQFGSLSDYDDNGEPTIESVLSNLDISSDISINKDKYETNLNTNLPKDNKSLIDRVVEFNKKHNAVKAKIDSFNLTDNPDIVAHISVDIASPEVINQAKALERNAAIYNKINLFLNKIGVTADFVSSTHFDSERALLDPSSGVVLANGLLNVIKLSNNQEALNDLPEELGHFLIECNSNNPLVTRATNYLAQNPDLIKEILGDDYDIIESYYLNNKRPDLILKEALGRVLIDVINNNIDKLQVIQRNFSLDSFLNKLKNIWNNIKNIFKIKSNSDKTSIEDLRNTLKPLLHSFDVSKSKRESIINRFKKYGEKMAHVNTLSQKYDDLFGKGGVIDYIRISIARENQYYSKTYKDIKDLEEEVKASEEAFSNFIKTREESVKDESENYKTNEDEILDIRNMQHFGKYIEKLNNLMNSQMKLLKEIQTSSQSYEDVLIQAKNLNTIKSFYETKLPTVQDLANFTLAIMNSTEDPQLEQFKEYAKSLNTITNEAIKLFDNLHEELLTTMNIITDYFWENSVDPEIIANIFPENIVKNNNLTDNGKKIHFLLNTSLGDINSVFRMFSTYYDQRDQLINIVNNVIRKQEERSRLATQLFLKELSELANDYIDKTGSRDFSFIYETDENNIPTGFLKTIEGVDIAKWRKYKDEFIKRINNDSSLSEEEKQLKIKNFINRTLTTTKGLANYKFNYETNTFDKVGLGASITIPTNNIKSTPEAVNWTTNSFDRLNENQKEFLIKYLELKNKLESLLPNTTRYEEGGLYYRAVQRVVSSVGEIILNKRNKPFQLLGGYLADSILRINENDSDYTVSEDSIFTALFKKGKNAITKNLRNILYPNKSPEENLPDTTNPAKNLEIKSAVSEYEQNRRVPVYFTKMLEPSRLASLSTDAIGSLSEYAMACFRFNSMNEIADMMELTYERAKYRRIQKTKYGKNFIRYIKDPKSQNQINQIITTDALGSTMLKSLRDLLDTKLYSEYNVDSNNPNGLSPSKITQFMLKTTAFSMLGYNIFSAINNLTVGKYQTMVEAFSGNHFTKKDWIWAEKEYHKLLPEYLKDLNSDTKTSKLWLINELFNGTMEWKEQIEGSKYYMNNALKTLSKFDSGVLMNIGESNLRLIGLLAKMHNYKMKDSSGNESNLYDALETEHKLNKNGKKISGKLKIKNGYTKENGDKFSMTAKTGFDKSDLFDFCLSANVMAHRLHGVYNKEDMASAKRYWWGKLLLLFRNFIVSTTVNRWGGTHYNTDTKQWEEGFYTTALKFLGRCIIGDQEDMTFSQKVRASLNNMNDIQKGNLRKCLAEFGTLGLLALLVTFGLKDWKDDDEYTTRAINYFSRRLMQEIEFYQPWNLNSIGDILQSPSATLGLLTRYGRFVKSVKDIHVLENGPYKGQLNIWVNFKKALPLYPQIRDMIEFGESDTRFEIFE